MKVSIYYLLSKIKGIYTVSKFNYDFFTEQILPASEDEVFMYVNILTCIILIYKTFVSPVERGEKEKEHI